MLKKGILITILILSLLIFGRSSFAIEIPNPLEYDTFAELVEAIITFIFYLSVALAPLMVLVGAFYFLTSGGDPKRVETGKKIILYTILGFAIILFAKGIIAVVRHILGGLP